MPRSSDQTRVGRTLTLGGGAESSLEGRDIELSSRRKTSVLRPMISARTARIDDNLGRGTDGSNPLPSSEESAANPESLDQAVLISGGPQVKRRRVPAPGPDRPHVIASDDRAAAPKSKRSKPRRSVSQRERHRIRFGNRSRRGT